MKKTTIILIVLVVLLIFFTEGLAAPLQKSLVHADPNWVVHLDLQKYTSSRLHAGLLNHEIMDKLRAKNAEISTVYGIDPIKDIKSVTVYGLDVKEKETVICVDGTFNREKLFDQIRKKAHEAPQEETYHQNTIYSWDSDKYIVFAKEGPVIIGMSDKAIKTALDVIARKKQDISASPLKSELDKAPSDAILTAAVENISLLVKHSKPVILKKMGNALFTLAERQEDLVFDLNIFALTPEDAKNMEQIVRGLIAMANLQKEDIPAELKLPEDLTIQTKGNTVRMGFTYPVEYIIQLIAKKGSFLRSSFMAEFSPLS